MSTYKPVYDYRTENYLLVRGYLQHAVEEVMLGFSDGESPFIGFTFADFITKSDVGLIEGDMERMLGRYSRIAPIGKFNHQPNTVYVLAAPAYRYASQARPPYSTEWKRFSDKDQWDVHAHVQEYAAHVFLQLTDYYGLMLNERQEHPLTAQINRIPTLPDRLHNDPAMVRSASEKIGETVRAQQKVRRPNGQEHVLSYRERVALHEREILTLLGPLTSTSGTPGRYNN